MRKTGNAIASSVIDAIGRTPLVELSRFAAGVDGRILLKLEYLNPGHSKKDRAAKQLVLEAKSSGELRPGQTVVELTSGNMGTGLAIVCAATGHPFVAVMSKGNSQERALMMRALGAEVVLVDQAPESVRGEVSGADLALVEAETQRITTARRAFRSDQFERFANRDAHYAGTAAEIWQQSGGVVTAFCDFAGSGGTFAGCSRYFRERNASIRCYVVEPEGAATLSGDVVKEPRHPIQGGGYAMPALKQLEGVPPDGFITVSGDEAADSARRLAKSEGLFTGYSTGANLAAALSLLDGPLAGAVVAVIACDSGMKYLSTPLWS